MYKQIGYGKLLDENQVAEYAGYLCFNTEMPDQIVIAHVEHCIQCKLAIMEVCDLMDQILVMAHHSNRPLI